MIMSNLKSSPSSGVNRSHKHCLLYFPFSLVHVFTSILSPIIFAVTLW